MQAVLAPAVVLPVLGVLAVLSVVWVVYRVKSGNPVMGSTPATSGGFGAHLGTLQDSPILHLIAASLAQMGHDSGHKLVNALILKLIPGLGAILTLPVDKILDGIDGQIIAGGSPTTPTAPATPGAPAVLSFPVDHPDYPIIKGVLDALAARKKAA